MTDAQSGVLLCGQSLVSFSSGMSEQERNDILDCLNYSELRADGKSDRRQAWRKWINHYQAGLFKSGFELSGALSSNIVAITERRELLDVARDAIQGSGHRELSELAHSALNTFLRSQQVEAFFQNGFSVSQNESFQVVPCCRVATGAIDVMVCGIHMQRDTTDGSWLDRPESFMKIRMDGGAYRYSAQAYEPYRAKVTKGLERFSRIYFDSLS
ncbi:hypothetical protein CFII64_20473 [Pseudomonas sp. CFII64]|uniref:hypothetical protein n=1 Tax=Pseudomonas sp. CFII64 TaxID=911242 RepID=UPI000357DF90|nr:hypothetical protein [Pseudomonas sp. CFII64]EPJ79631.1 hypothetical protein CFII64_20473 [Pseudomonas sp. CFII64]